MNKISKQQVHTLQWSIWLNTALYMQIMFCLYKIYIKYHLLKYQIIMAILVSHSQL